MKARKNDGAPHFDVEGRIVQRRASAGDVLVDGLDTPIAPRGHVVRKNRLVGEKNQREGILRADVLHESLGGGFHVLDGMEQPVAEIKGDWKGWNFRFLTPDGVEIGTVTKKWAGIGKEFFTSADNYMISLNEDRAFRPESAPLLLAAGLAIDTVYKEK
jgi:hypothetical protein